jgi:hypothetical protein
MKLRAFAGIAVAALAASAALAFENTAWYGALECKTKVKVEGERAEREVETAEAVSLNTTDSTFTMGPIAGGDVDGLILKKNNTHYSVAQPTDETDLAAFTAWVKAKILAQTGLDVDLTAVEMKGSFILVKRFSLVKVNIRIKWYGTVASGEHMGQTAFGSIALKGVLPRD